MKLGVERRQSFMASRAPNVRSKHQVLGIDVLYPSFSRLFSECRSIILINDVKRPSSMVPHTPISLMAVGISVLHLHKLAEDRSADPSSFLDVSTDRRTVSDIGSSSLPF